MPSMKWPWSIGANPIGHLTPLDRVGTVRFDRQMSRKRSRETPPAGDGDCCHCYHDESPAYFDGLLKINAPNTRA